MGNLNRSFRKPIFQFKKSNFWIDLDGSTFLRINSILQRSVHLFIFIIIYLSYYQATGTSADYIRVYNARQSESIQISEQTDVDYTVNCKS